MKATSEAPPKPPDTSQIEKVTTPLLKQSAIFIIKTEEQYIASAALVERHDSVLRQISEMFDPFVSGLHRMHKAAIELRGKFYNPVAASKQAILRERVRHEDAQARIRREEAARAAEKLREQQQKDLAKEAKKLERAGDKETATELREQAENLPLPVVAPVPAVPQQQGFVTREDWEFTVTDYALVPDAFRLLDPTKATERALIDSKIRAVVSKLGDSFPIAGVEVRKVRKQHTRSVA